MIKLFTSKYGKGIALLFLMSLVYGFLVLFLRNAYEADSSIIKSDWNTVQLKGDAKNFYDRAVVLAKFQPYHSGNIPAVAYYRPPVYPVLMASVFLVSGNSIRAVIVMQILLACIIVIMIADTGRIIFNETVGLISGIVAVLYYPLWNSSVTINSELLSMFFWIISLNILLKCIAGEGNSTRMIILSGLFAGLAALTRGQFLFMAPLSLLFVYYSVKKSGKEKIKIVSYWLPFFLLPALLWMSYAYFISGIFVFVSTQGLFSMWWGWSPAVVIEEGYPIWNPEWQKIVTPEDQIGVLVATRNASWYINEITSFIIKYPGESFLIGIFKLMDGWGIDFFNSHKDILKGLFRFIKINWDLILAIPAFIVILKHKTNRGFLKFIIYASIVYTLVSLLTAALYRYRFPYLDPLFIILTAFTIVYYFLRFRKIKFEYKDNL